jgi:hypothetical protein
MSVEIYVYHDPYRLKENKNLWKKIIKCPYFCVSQTLVNGLRKIYSKDFEAGRVTTVRNLTESLYSEWLSTACAVRQHTDIDNIINAGTLSVLSDKDQENLGKAFLFNRDDVFTSIRTMFELRMDINDIVKDKLTPEQVYIVEIFNKVLSSDKKKDFDLKEDFSIEEVTQALIDSVTKAKEGFDAGSLDLDTVVIHGVHQFSPIMLRTIEEIAKYKNVVLLFNYQKQYKTVYQTWIDIYSAFDCPIIDEDGNEFHTKDSSSVSYEGNVLADNIGKMLNGRKDDVLISKPYEILEFDNMTEFAEYTAKVFENAQKKDPDHPMTAMSEQIYAANSSANDILKIYFPEQFGERQFMNYPLGHFFISIANMWDAGTNGINIADINDIVECLGAGILEETRPGELVSIFERIRALFDGCTTVDEMLSRLKRVRKNQKYITDATRQKYVNHISYYAISAEEIGRLEKALNDLEELAVFFYEDFEKRPHNFRDFYNRLKKYLQEEIADDRELDDDFSDIISRVLARLDEVEAIDASASFECLKSTMSLYLVQETKPGKSANWIVRNFEQIDGDVLRTQNEEKTTLHFACLSDEDMGGGKNSEFTWPLNADFFEVAQDPVDWKYQVYVRSRKEYKYFKRYALIFGLQFNRGKYKLSYVKRDGDREKDPYYLFKILGIEEKKYSATHFGEKLEDTTGITLKGSNGAAFNHYDYYRYRICRYRFMMESLIERNTVYKDNFLLIKYLEVWLENETKEKMQGLPCSEVVLVEKLNEIYDELKKYFPYVLNVNRMDVINNVRGRLSSQKKFPVLTEKDREYMMIRDLFIYKKLEDPKSYKQDVLKDIFIEVNQDRIDQELAEESNVKYKANSHIWCKYCTNREICVAYYANTDQ